MQILWRVSAAAAAVALLVYPLGAIGGSVALYENQSCDLNNGGDHQLLISESNFCYEVPIGAIHSMQSVGDLGNRCTFRLMSGPSCTGTLLHTVTTDPSTCNCLSDSTAGLSLSISCEVQTIGSKREAYNESSSRELELSTVARSAGSGGNWCPPLIGLSTRQLTTALILQGTIRPPIIIQPTTPTLSQSSSIIAPAPYQIPISDIMDDISFQILFQNALAASSTQNIGGTAVTVLVQNLGNNAFATNWNTATSSRISMTVFVHIQGLLSTGGASLGTLTTIATDSNGTPMFSIKTRRV